jgi:protein-S-isoprenylcysteine O-methyltransferase Ste14
LRHVASIAALPFVIAVVVPVWIARTTDATFGLASRPANLALQLGGVLVIVLGLVLFASSLDRFARDGRGTLAPWDPPKEFVASGPYGYVRNPMISGVILILLGEAMSLRSVTHLEWTAAVFVINALYIPLFEEPQLVARFGPQYERYRRHVPRLVPRLRPWTPNPRAGRRTTSPRGTVRGGPRAG